MWLRWLVVMLLLSFSAASRAEDSDDYTRLVSEAVREYNAGAWSEARTLFERAHALQPNARTHRAIGLVEIEQGDYVAAIAELRAALADSRHALTPDLRSAVAEAIERSQRYVGTVEVLLMPPTATLLLDGRILEQRTLQLNTGEYRFAAKARGYHDATLPLRVEGGKSQQLELRLVARGDVPEPAPSVPAERGDTQRLLGWAALGVGAVGLAVGVAFELQRASTVHERNQICPSAVDCEPGSQARVDRLTDQARNQAAIEVISLIAGAVFAAGGLTLVLSAPREEQAVVALRPLLGLDRAGAVLSARMF